MYKANITELKRKMVIYAISVGNFNKPFLSLNKSSRQKINKEIADFNNAINQIDLTDICSTFYPTAVEYTFFLNTHGTFSRIDRMLSHKTNLRRLKLYKVSLLSTMMEN